MADWYGTTRSNYFIVNDEESFRKMASGFDVEIVEKEGKFAFLSTSGDGDIPTQNNGDTLEDISIVDVIHQYLSPNQVCIVQSIGNEKKRYLTGIAVAISPSGEKIEISINDIYKTAQEEFGSDFEITEATY